MSISAVALLFAAAITLHDLEEALFLPAWIHAHLKVRFNPNPKAYWIVTLLVSLLAWIVALGVSLTPENRAFHLALSGFALAMAINVFLPHAIASIVKRSYSPGAATGLLFNLPLGVMLIKAEWSTGIASPASFWRETVAYAVLLSTVALGSLYLLHAVFKKPGAA